MAVGDTLRDLVVEAGREIGKAADDVVHFVTILEDNWEDSTSLVEAKPEQLVPLGLPLRFARALVGAACRNKSTTSAAVEEPDKDTAGPKHERSETAGPKQGRRRGGSSKQSKFFTEHTSRDGVTVLTIGKCEANFALRARILGKSGQNLKHIEDETGGKVTLRGDNGDKEMCLEIRGRSSEEKQQAVEYAKDLVKTVETEYKEFIERGPADDEALGDTNVSDASPEANSNKFHRTIDLDECDPAFTMRGRILGFRGRNLSKIEAQTWARVRLLGSDDGPMALQIDADNKDSLEEALRLASDLVESLYTEYEEWAAAEADWEGDGPRRRKGGERKARGKGEDSKGGDVGKGGKRSTGPQADAAFKKNLKVKLTEPGFRMGAKVVGNSGCNLQHIELETGASLQLHGSSGEPMTICITADSSKILHQAAQMAKDLLDTLYAEYDEWLANADGKGSHRRGAEKESGEFIHTVDIDTCDPGFTLRGRLLGFKGCNLSHIQDLTGSRVELLGNSDEPMSLEIRATSSKDLEKTVELAQDLISSIYDEYEDWLANVGERETNGGGWPKASKGKKSSKGSSKSGKGGSWEAKGSKGSKGGKSDKGEWRSRSQGGFTKTLPLKNCDPDFGLRSKVLGRSGRNLSFIEEETASTLSILGHASDGDLHIEFNAPSEADLDKAMSMAKDLLKTVYVEYSDWLQERRDGSYDAQDYGDQGKGKGGKGCKGGAKRSFSTKKDFARGNPDAKRARTG